MKPHFQLPPPLNALLATHTRCTAAAITLAVICYWNSLQGGLVHDDIFAIRDNADVRPETPIGEVFSNDFWGRPMSSNVSHKSYRPFTVLTFRANYALHGLEPWGYHAVNLALHALATIVLGVLSRRLAFPQPDLVFLVMCLFASHPVHTEAVSGIVGRAELLSSVCFLFSLLSYTTALKHTAGRQALGVCGCVVWGGVAMLFKENGATVFGVCLTYDLLIHSHKLLWRSLARRSSQVFRSLFPLLFRSGVLLGSTLTLLALRVSLLHGQLPQFSDHDNPASFSPHTLTRALTYGYLYFFNARLLVFPLTLCYDWQMGSIPLVETLTDVRNIGTPVFFIFLTCMLVTPLYHTHSIRYMCQGHKVVLLSLSLMVVPFLPASNLLLRVGFVVAERILYIPSMGYCILLVQGIKVLSLRLRPSPHPHITSSSHPPTLTKSPPPPPHPLHTPSPPHTVTPPHLFHACLLLVVVFSLRTVVRNTVWSTRESLFRSGLATVPHNAKIHYNYANYLRDSGRPEEAAHHYRQALRLAPDHVSSHNNLGSLPVVSVEEAEFHFREAVRLSPSHYRAHYNLGNNLLDQGRLAEAEQALLESLTINPDYHGSLMTLATVLSDTGQEEQGLQYMRRAVSAAPQDTLVHNNMAALLIRQGEVEEAIGEYHHVLSLDPRQPQVMTNLARAYRSLGDNTNAEHWFLESLSEEEDVATYTALGALYFNTGKYHKAKLSFSGALALDPHNLETRCNYCQCLIQLDQREKAEIEALSALQDHSHPACLHLILASVYSQKKMMHKAYNHSTLALETTETKSRAEAHQIHASILKDMGQLDRAEENYRQAITLSPTLLNAHMNLGALLHLKKRYGEARIYYNKALALDPGNKMVSDNLAKLNRIENSS